MKALTIWQPWASLIAAGVKQYETCSWSTAYRGELAIHAAKRWTQDARDFTDALVNMFADQLRGMPVTLPRGAVLCVARLVDVIQTDPDFAEGLDRFERSFGDFSAGRYAWKLEIVEVFNVPIPARGRGGLWEWQRDAGLEMGQ